MIKILALDVIIKMGRIKKSNNLVLILTTITLKIKIFGKYLNECIIPKIKKKSSELLNKIMNMKFLDKVKKNKNEDDLVPKRAIYFSHGQDSSPKSLKIIHLKKIAEDKGFTTFIPDHSEIESPEERIEKLLSLDPKAREHLVFVGSSLGSYVTTCASKSVKLAGLFLMAPAFYMEGLQDQNPEPVSSNTFLIHGWDDDVIPYKNSIRFAKQWKSRLFILPGNHGLLNQLGEIGNIFSDYLDLILSQDP